MRNDVMAWLNFLFNWILRISTLNLLWILFTIAGGFIVGIFPATVSAYIIIKSWLKGNVDISIFKSFKKTFKEEFITSNIIGLPLLVLGVILIIDYYILLNLNETWGTFILFLLIHITFIFIILIIYVFPIYTYYKCRIIKCYKLSILFGIRYPLHTVILIVNIIANFIIMLLVPGLIPFFSVILMFIFIEWYSSKLFRKYKIIE